MYISEFWCGVGACLLAEVITIVIALIISLAKFSGNYDYEEHREDKEDKE